MKNIVIECYEINDASTCKFLAYASTAKLVQEIIDSDNTRQFTINRFDRSIVIVESLAEFETVQANRIRREAAQKLTAAEREMFGIDEDGNNV